MANVAAAVPVAPPKAHATLTLAVPGLVLEVTVQVQRTPPLDEAV